MSGYATWVYAVTRDLRPDALSEVAGVAGEPVRTVTGHGLTAVIGSVDAEQFGEEGFERRLADPAELAAIARAHHGVVEAVSAAQAALPLRLATVYRDDDRVRDMLGQRRGDFAATLTWLAGRAEYGVKVWADLQELSVTGDEPPAAAGGPSGSRQGAGAAYLSRRRAQLSARDRRRQAAAEGGAAIHTALSALAAAGRQHPPQDIPLPGDHDRPGDGQPELMVLNGAYLVEPGSLPQFSHAAQSAVSARPGFRLELTGPWPPYSFAGGPEGTA
ncbi:MAG TPA: GvpL/GvpF family gas vesicle protein [Streptosporangiaceae bacterium]|nr:GvpL/GvpF family gas vesicle protein [Streptosporangiaceae bacterium]